MKAVWIPKFGKPDVLEVREHQDPAPEPGAVRIRVRAAGIDFADITARQGLYPDAPPPPMVVGCEVSGVIDAVGQGVTDRSEGQRVPAMTRFGGYADTVCVDATHCFVMPAEMSFEGGAVTPQIDRAFPFQQASEAHAYIEAGQNIGKVLLTP
jgi:NADPH:quinone reductase-like Zn-dependent oxidoreductase